MNSFIAADLRCPSLDKQTLGRKRGWERRKTREEHASVVLSIAIISVGEPRFDRERGVIFEQQAPFSSGNDNRMDLGNNFQRSVSFVTRNRIRRNLWKSAFFFFTLKRIGWEEKLGRIRETWTKSIRFRNFSFRFITYFGEEEEWWNLLTRNFFSPKEILF